MADLYRALLAAAEEAKKIKKNMKSYVKFFLTPEIW